MPRQISLFAATCLTCSAALADMPAEEWKPTLAASFSGEAIEECLGTTQEQSVCIGEQTSLCANTTEPIPSDFVPGICTEIELEWWDARLNAKYQDLIALHEDFDRQFGNTDNDPSQTLAGTYREAQRQWIGFRDASCNHASLSTGAMDGPVADDLRLTCLLMMTAERTLEMERVLSSQ